MDHRLLMCTCMPGYLQRYVPYLLGHMYIRGCSYRYAGNEISVFPFREQNGASYLTIVESRVPRPNYQAAIASKVGSWASVCSTLSVHTGYRVYNIQQSDGRRGWSPMIALRIGVRKA